VTRKATEPRNVDLLLRLTEREAAIIDAVVALDRRHSRQDVVMESVSRTMEQALKDELVRAQLELHAQRDAKQEGKVIRIQRPSAG